MTIDFAMPFITGLFVGGILTEVRWVLRLRQFQGQIGLGQSAELQNETARAQAETQGTTEAQSSLGLRLLRDHLAADGGATPVIEPATLGTRDA
jgi:hypothetical protein